MKIGDKVRWKSQSGGSWTVKEGEIVGIIPANTHIPRDIIPPFDTSEYWAWEKRFLKMFDGILPRKHESYLIAIPSKSGKGKIKLYWPVA